MKSCTKYTDNKGGGNTASNVSSTTDYLFLLSEYEVFATHQYCNDAEPNYQAQYDYFKAGNSKVANKHSATGTAAVLQLHLRLLLLRGFVVGVVGLLRRSPCVWCCARLCSLIPPQGFSTYSSPRKWAETSKFPSKNPKGASAPRENF